MKGHQELYKKISEEYGVPVHIVKSIVDSQFAFAANVIQSGNDESVRLQYLGTFLVSKNRRQKIEEKRKLAKRMRDEKDRQKK